MKALEDGEPMEGGFAVDVDDVDGLVDGSSTSLITDRREARKETDPVCPFPSLLGFTT